MRKKWSTDSIVSDDPPGVNAKEYYAVLIYLDKDEPCPGPFICSGDCINCLEGKSGIIMCRVLENNELCDLPNSE